MSAEAVAAGAGKRRHPRRQAHERQKQVPMAASPNSLLATCAATDGAERSSEAGEDGVTRAAGDYED